MKGKGEDAMKDSWRSFTVGVLLSIVGGLSNGRVLVADEIEILSITPAPPASIVGLEPWPAGGPMPPLTASNSVTVVVRYRTDGAAVRAETFPSRASVRSGLRVAEPGVGTDPACSSIAGPSEGRCAAAFFYVCDESSPATITIDQVGASLAAADNRVLVTDYQNVHLTVSCSPSGRPPRRDPGNCLVLGVVGVPGVAVLPFSRETPICRCLQDFGAREFRCAFLHPDFFMVRRVPLPLPQQFSEVWEFLPLTERSGTVTMKLIGAGLAKPVEHVFGPETSAEGKLERFVAECVSPHDPADLTGFAELEYVSDDGQSKTFRVDRTIVETFREKP